MKNKSFKKRAEEAHLVLDVHFADLKPTIKFDWDEWLAAHTPGWGGLERQMRAYEIKKIKKAKDILEKLIDDPATSHWLRLELKPKIADLKHLTMIKPLHGKQNTSLHTYKVSLIGVCRDIWINYHDAPPSLSHNDTNKFTVFVADVISFVFGHDFSARSAMEAYVISENTD